MGATAVRVAETGAADEAGAVAGVGAVIGEGAAMGAGVEAAKEPGAD